MLGQTNVRNRSRSGWKGCFAPISVAVLLRDKLHNGRPHLRQAYTRLLLRQVSVSDEEIRTCGFKAVLVRSASQGLSTVGSRTDELSARGGRGGIGS